MSRGSAPKIACVAAAVTLRKSELLTELAFAHEYSVWLSQSSALGAVHGASTGTVVDIWSSWVIAWAMSAATRGSGGAAPNGLVSENVERCPPKKKTFSPVS